MIRLIFTDLGRRRPNKRRLFSHRYFCVDAAFMLQKSVKISLNSEISDPRKKSVRSVRSV